MSTLTNVLGPKVTNVAELLGLIFDTGSTAGQFNDGWFEKPLTSIEKIPQQLPQLLTLFQDLLPSLPSPPPQPAGSQWYSIPNPAENGQPTGFYLVAPAPTSGITSADIGLGLYYSGTFSNLSITAAIYFPLFALSTSDNPQFVLGSTATQISLSLVPTSASTPPPSLSMDVSFTCDGSVPPTLDLTVTSHSDPSTTYDSLKALLGSNDQGAPPLLNCISDLLLAGATCWLNVTVGTLGGVEITVGDILGYAGILTDTAGSYSLNTDFLSTNASALAENVLFGLLSNLANTASPLIPIKSGSSTGGIFIVSATDATTETTDYGLRLQIQDIPIYGGSGKDASASGEGASAPEPEFLLQLGKGLVGDPDGTASWIANAKGPTDTLPGISLFFLEQVNNALAFSFSAEMVSVGCDVKSASDQPLIDVDGCVLSGAELRFYLDWVLSPEALTFGVAASLDGLGLPLGPGFGSVVQDSTSNPVAQSLLESGSDDSSNGDDSLAGDPPVGRRSTTSRSADEGDASGSGAAAGGDQDPVNPSFSISAAYVNELVVQLYDQDGQPADEVTLPIQRAFGPLQCQQIGVGWKQSARLLSVLFDGGVSVAGLSIQLDGLTIGVPVTDPADFSKYSFDLAGLGLTFEESQVELSAAFLKALSNTTPPYPQYEGEALLQASSFAIGAVGAYAYVPPPAGSKNGYASLFVYGMLGAELGDPTETGAFLITGVSAGAGFNRALVVPEWNTVETFPLLEALNDPSGAFAGSPPDPAKALAKFGAWVPPQRGTFWLAAGLKFSTYDLLSSNVLATVTLGKELEVGLLGLSWMSLPPPPAPGGEPPPAFAYLGLALQMQLLPVEGVFAATAAVTSNSFVIDPACHLTGGFAFYFWFGENPNAGQFVLTLGGYDPNFQAPDCYPQVAPLGFNWPVSSNVTLNGGVYFALVPSAIMTGGALNLTYQSGSLQAWLIAQLNIIAGWAPFHFSETIGVTVGASYRAEVCGIHKTFKADITADLDLWGPKTGGSARLHFYFVSVGVAFGAGAIPPAPPLPWVTQPAGPSTPSQEGFSDTLLPASILSLKVDRGLIATYPNSVAGQASTLWVVRPGQFAFSATSAIPSTQVTLTSASAPPVQVPSSQSVAIRPMSATLQSVGLSVSVNSADTSDPQPPPFTAEALKQNLPPAKWGAPVTGSPDPEEEPIEFLIGLTRIVPAEATSPPSNTSRFTVSLRRALKYDCVDSKQADHLPLVPSGGPLVPPPRRDPHAAKVIHDTLMAEPVVLERQAVFEILRRRRIAPHRPGSLSRFAEHPTWYLTGQPWLEQT